MRTTQLLCALIISSAVFALVECAELHAQEPAARLSITRIDNTKFPNVQAFVSVLDATGRPAEGLTRNDFQLEENGTLVSDFQVDRVVDTQTPVLLVLAFDTSGSMDGEKLAAAKAAASGLLQTLSAGDQVALISFGDTVTVALQPTAADSNAVTQALDAFEASGNTALFDGAYQALRVAAGSPLARRAVVLLTDGEDYGGVSISKREDVVRLAESSAIPVYAIGLGEDADQALLTELSTLAGGEALHAASQEELGGLFDRLGQVLRNQYRITFRSKVLADSKTYPLSVRITAGGQQLQANASVASKPVQPTVAVGSLDDLARQGQSPSGTVELVPALTAQGRVVRVEFLIDSAVVHTATEAPFRYVLNADALSRGKHIISIRATDISGNVGLKEYPFDLTGTSFNWGLVFLAAGAAVALALGMALFYRAGRRRRVASGGEPLPEADPEPDPSLPATTLFRTADEDMQPASARLVLRSGTDQGRSFGLTAAAVTIGRDDDCEVSLRDSRHTVSRQHARIYVEDGTHVIEDLGSTNGTMVNGKRVEWARLESGDQIEVGDVRLEFVAPLQQADMSLVDNSRAAGERTVIGLPPDA